MKSINLLIVGFFVSLNLFSQSELHFLSYNGHNYVNVIQVSTYGDNVIVLPDRNTSKHVLINNKIVTVNNKIKEISFFKGDTIILEVVKSEHIQYSDIEYSYKYIISNDLGISWNEHSIEHFNSRIFINSKESFFIDNDNTFSSISINGNFLLDSSYGSEEGVRRINTRFHLGQKLISDNNSVIGYNFYRYVNGVSSTFHDVLNVIAIYVNGEWKLYDHKSPILAIQEHNGIIYVIDINELVFIVGDNRLLKSINNPFKIKLFK